MIEAIVGVALRAILASVLLGGVLAALVLVATRTLSLKAATRHALWITALAATALMPLAGVGMSFLKGAPAQPPVQSTPARSADELRSWSKLATSVRTNHDVALAPSSRLQPQTTRIQASSRPAIVAPAQSVVKPPPSFIAVVVDRLGVVRWTPRVSRAIAVGVVTVWALGALIGLIGLAASIVRVRGLKRRSSPLDGALADELPWLTEIGPGREIYLRLSFETETPVAIGFRRPVILIPTELATADGLAAIESLILHEQAHLRRNDDWTNLLQRVIERVFWFNPVVWLVGRRIALEREIASDDAVVEKTGEAHAYATSLWKLVREMRMPEHAVVAPGALLTRKQITVRIEQLLDKKRGRLHRSPVTALGVALAGVLSVAFVATSAPAVELPAAAATQAATSTPAVPSRHAVAALRNAASAHAKRPATQNDAIARDVQAQLKQLREQLAAAQSSAKATRAKMFQSAERAPLPPLPPIVAAPPATSPQPLAKLQAQPDAAVRSAERAAHVRELSRANYDAQIERTVALAMAAIPHRIALEMNGVPGRHTKFDGVKLTREMVTSCVACSFRNADARGLDLHDLKLNADNFTGADMRGVNLSGARLAAVSLASANLGNADLRGAQLTGVELRGTIFDGAQLEGVRMAGVSLRRLGLRGATLRSVMANCVGCDFGGLDLHGQDLHGLTLTGADFNHADLHEANLSGVRFFSVDLSHANLRGADLSDAHFETCDLDGADLRGARTTGMTTNPGGLDG